jgi:signal transduction histidine kinase/ActR/RegA family two-component response regulator
MAQIKDTLPEQMQINPITLSFQGECRELESVFIADYKSKTLKHSRISLTLGIIFYAVFGFLDIALVPQQATQLWFIRYVVVCPAMIVSILLSFIPTFKNHIQAILLFIIILAGGGISVMVAIVDPPANFSYYAGLILVFMLSYGFIRGRFIWTTIGGWINVILYEVIAIYIVQTPDMILLNNNFFFISANLIGMFTCYSIEFYARRDFFMNRRLEYEQDKTLSLNRDLEKRVLERTASLNKNNERLKKEIKARELEKKEKESLERQLVQAHKMESIGTLAGGIAHDFNNILSSIIGYTELTLDDIETGTLAADNLQEVYKAGIRAKDLVKQILAFARQSDESMKPIQIHPIVEDVLKLIRSTIPTTIEINVDMKSDALIVGNSTQIHQVMMNLCTNAAQAMEENGGCLNISLKNCDIGKSQSDKMPELEKAPYIEIMVTDTGIGIAPDIIESVFEPYFTTKPQGKGTGMGLSMVHGIVESHGGKITVKSTLGKGTQFTVFLPVSKETIKFEQYEFETLPKGSEHILIVDDEAQITRMLAKILKSLGYKVSTRAHSMEALELFCNNPNDFDAVVTDMTMPNMTGDKLAEKIKAIRPDVPVILCTGFSEKINEDKEKLYIDAFLMKPVGKAEMAKTVRRVLNEAKGSTSD